MEEARLQVSEASPRDVGRKIARIPVSIMSKIGVSTGDIIEIMGKRATCAIVWPLGSEEKNEVISIDGLLRKSAGVSLSDYVIVKKAETRDAIHIMLSPSGYKLSEIDEDFNMHVKSVLLDKPYTIGDFISLPIFGGSPLYFTVASTRPKGIVIVTGDTKVEVSPEPREAEIGVPRVTYEDIGGLREEIQRIREMVELPLRHPELFERLGIEPPKGVLLHGPPGCGKTLLAKAVANEAEANFYSINGPEIMSKFYGESEERLRQVFREAQENSPSIIFIDEVDAIAPKREEVSGEVEKRIVSQLLTLMDGITSRGQIVVIAATNRPNAIDPALRRPGRFDREIEIGIPDKRGRLEILQIHTRNMPLDSDVDMDRIAEITRGYTGADLAALCKEAAMKALRRYLPQIDLEKERVPPEVLRKMQVKMEDFMNAYKEIVPTAMREVYVESPNVHWDDVGNLDDVKQQLREMIEWPMKNPEKFRRIGIKPPRGILLYGPPGCGKTLLAKAVATESGANFITIRGPEVFSKWVGESERAIREIFRKARMAAPSVIFIDEIDSIAPKRELGFGDSAVSERVISQLLTEMDGLITLENVVVMAATNKPHMLDSALLRPGRFDYLVYIPKPDHKARLEILKVHTRNMPLEDRVHLNELSEKTEGFSGADLEALCREAGLNAIRKDREKVTLEDFQEALQKIKPSITPQVEERYKAFQEERV
ncbi:MAG: CDC48 family AAA ATPase [Nitrososphaerota archaeon]|nr:CDC48 family AAA ATPase [Candidatus Bathyarchaeota archaeon]MDW8049073.1 CDC48 family AAA ATPase [Nitrososphaerota archaeon]